MNDLSDDALVIGDYLVRTNGHEDGVPYSLAARVAGEVVLETRGVSVREAQEFTVTVTEYAESDCKLEDIGQSDINDCHEYGKSLPAACRSRVQFAKCFSSSSGTPPTIYHGAITCVSSARKFVVLSQ